MERLDSSGNQQRGGLCDRFSYRPIRLHPGKHVLHRTVCYESSGLAQIGRGLNVSRNNNRIRFEVQ